MNDPRESMEGPRLQVTRSLTQCSEMAARVRRLLGLLGKDAALIPSSKKRGGLGVVLDIPLGHKDAAFVRSHFDGIEVRLNDAPRE